MIGDDHSDARERGAQAAADGRGALQEVVVQEIPALTGRGYIGIEEHVVGTSLDADGHAGGLRVLDQWKGFDGGQVDDVDARSGFAREADHHRNCVALGLGRAGG